MKTVLIVLLSFVALSFALSDVNMILDDNVIASINNQKLSWTAGRNPRFEGVTVAEVKRMLGARRFVPKHPSEERISSSDSTQDIPASFDSRDKWGKCIHPILDQGKCGSCWAFGATESLSDRLCIASNGTIDVVLSPQSLVSCDWEGNMGCNGGTPQLAWAYMALAGVATMDCFPYTSGANATRGPCESKCADGSPIKKYHSKSFSAHTWSNVQDIQTAILNDGPVEGAFTVYSDFMTYTSGVYVKSPKATVLGGHAIKIIGWGTDSASGKDYWIVANSWNTTWGMKGFFWIERGTNMCGIDHDVCAGLPKI